MSAPPQVLTLDEARELLAEHGITFDQRQIQRAAEPNAEGKRKLPFFKDPVDGRLKIEKTALLRVYYRLIKDAERNSLVMQWN